MPGTTEIHLAGMTIPDFADHVADPSRYSGGGSVGAASAAFSASLAELVMTLSGKRKKNRANIEIIDRDLARVRALRQRFLDTIDEDARLLDQLMGFFGNRNPESASEYTASLFLAADEPLQLAADVDELLQIILTQVKFASRFTVADLAAAAAIGFASAYGGLMMTGVNLSLLANREQSDSARIDQMEGQRDRLASNLDRLNDEIQTQCRNRLQPSNRNIENGAQS